MRSLLTLALAALAAFHPAAMGQDALAVADHERKTLAYDGFEGAQLSDFWTNYRFAPGALEIQSEVTRRGERAAKLTLCPGDLAESGGPGNLPVERAELMETPPLWARDDVSYVYLFSLHLPEDFPVVPTRLVIAQWKQLCIRAPCVQENPVLSVRYIGGELIVKQYTGRKSNTLYRAKASVLNRWLDFRFEVRFSPRDTGYVRGWLSEDLIVDYAGVSGYQPEGGYPRDGLYFFKTGLYRDQMSECMSIYIDEYRKELTATGVN